MNGIRFARLYTDNSTNEKKLTTPHQRIYIIRFPQLGRKLLTRKGANLLKTCRTEGVYKNMSNETQKVQQPVQWVPVLTGQWFDRVILGLDKELIKNEEEIKN